MGGVKGTRYLFPIDFCNIRSQKMSVKNAEKVIKNYFRILKKPHAYLQTILKTPVKFQKDRTETVGGVKGTKYLLKTLNHAPRTTENQKQCPSTFLRKGGEQKNVMCDAAVDWCFNSFVAKFQTTFVVCFSFFNKLSLEKKFIPKVERLNVKQHRSR